MSTLHKYFQLNASNVRNFKKEPTVIYGHTLHVTGKQRGSTCNEEQMNAKAHGPRTENRGVKPVEVSAGDRALLMGGMSRE